MSHAGKHVDPRPSRGLPSLASLAPLGLALGLALGLLEASPAAAQALGNLQEGDDPLEINAEEGIEWNHNNKTYVARGNARAASGDVEVLAEVLTAYYRESEDGNSEIFMIEATGDVRISSPEGTVYGDKGQYKLDEQVFIMTGQDLRLEGEKDRLTARDSLEYWEAKQQAVARGDANAYHEDKRIRADVLTANFVENAENEMEVRRIDARGNVQIRTQTEFVTGNEGVYYVDRELATLSGDVKITQDQNQLNGQFAEVNLKTGVSTLKGAVPGGQGQTPVTAIVMPKAKPKAETADPEEEPEAAPEADSGS